MIGEGHCINSTTITYVYSQDMLIAEKDASGATIATYLYDHAGHPVSMTRGGKTYYYHYNAHGDTIALTDDSGNIADRYAYDIWGNIISKEGDIANPFTYGGQWGYIHDDESGLYFLKTRYYDPSIGRFISRDRFAGFENDPDSQNRYVYCNNDPVNNVDPSGLFSWRGIPNKLLAIAIDVAIIVISGVNAWISFNKLKQLLSNNTYLTRVIKKQIMKYAGSKGSIVFGTIMNIVLAVIGASIGDIIAYVIDNYIDPRLGYKKGNGWCFG